jgi:hypothetical protein
MISLGSNKFGLNIIMLTEFLMLRGWWALFGGRIFSS